MWAGDVYKRQVQTVSATVHEIAHSKLHNQKKIQIANDEQYQEIELFDKPGLFSNGGLPVIICRRAFIAMTCAVLTTTPESRSV